MLSLHSSRVFKHVFRTCQHFRTSTTRTTSAACVPVIDILKRPATNEVVTVKGWVRNLRKQKEVTFLHVSDGTSLKHLQIVAASSQLPREVSFGSCVKVNGTLQQSHGKGQSSEVLMKSLEVIGDCEAEDFPLKARVRHSPDYLRQFIHIRPRTNLFGALLRLRGAATQAINNFFMEEGYLQIHTPVITANDCEGGGDVFSVQPAALSQKETGNKEDTDAFFNVPAYLTVSGQLHLEIMASTFNKVYTFNPTFRAENSRGRHHLSEFWMVEAELAFTESLEDIMSVIEKLVKSVTESLLTKNSEDLTLFFDHVAPKGQRELFQSFIDHQYIRMTYTDAINVLGNSKEKFDFSPKWGSDLQKEHERYLVKHCGNIPVFVTDFPTELKAFYARQNDDSATVAAVDLLGANVGELCGGSLREERHSHMKERLEALGMTEAYDWYLDLRRYGSCPHGGFGVGFERYLQAILGINNIRDTLPFPRSRSQCQL